MPERSHQFISDSAFDSQVKIGLDAMDHCCHIITKFRDIGWCLDSYLVIEVINPHILTISHVIN